MTDLMITDLMMKDLVMTDLIITDLLTTEITRCIIGGIIILLMILCVKVQWKKRHRLNFPKKYMPYEGRDILTKAERAFYVILKEKCDEYGIIICPKVRLEDFIEVTDQKDWYRYRGYIKSRHVDFVLCDQELNIICAVELDDASHESDMAKATDDFKNRLFKTIGIDLYRIKTRDDYEYRIEKILQNM